MNTTNDATLAWTIWNLIQDFQQFLWDRYEQQFLTFIIEEEDLRNTAVPSNSTTSSDS